jgi:hypothetical protein
MYFHLQFLLLAFVGTTLAKISQVTGDYAVTIGTTVYNPAAGKDVKLSKLACSGTIKVRGIHSAFDIKCSTLGVYDYSLTGAPDAQRRSFPHWPIKQRRLVVGMQKMTR